MRDTTAWAASRISCGRAVVLLELDDRRLGVVALEVEDVLDVGARASRRSTGRRRRPRTGCGRRRERPDPQVLRPVRVLVLVDVEVAPARVVRREGVGRLLEQVDGAQQQVVEVERVRGPQPLPVARGEAGDHPLPVVDGVLGEERLVEHLVLGPADRAEDRGRPELAGRRQVLLGAGSASSAAAGRRCRRSRTAGRARSPRRPCRSTRAHSAWNVPAWTSLPCSPTSAVIRSRSSPAARLVNVTARIRRGWTALTPIRYAIRWAITRVLPEPAPGEDQQRALGGGDGARLLGVEAADDLLGAGRAPGLDRGRDGLGVERRTRGRELGLARPLAQPLGLLGDGIGLGGAAAPAGPRGRSDAGGRAGPGPRRRGRATSPAPSGSARRVRRRFAGSLTGVGLTHPF